MLFLREDVNERSEEGGYAFFETSTLPFNTDDDINTVSAMMESPLLESTGCTSIQYTCIIYIYTIIYNYTIYIVYYILYEGL